MSAPGHNNVPPVGEEIHLPGPSLLPLGLAVGLTLVVVGLTISWVLIATGAILSVYTFARWVADTRRDIAELPPEHAAH